MKTREATLGYKKILLTSFSLLLLILAKPVLAQEATDSGSPSLEETGKAIRERFQRLGADPKRVEKIKGIVNQLSQQKRGFIGQVDRITEESLTITNSKGTEIIPIAEEVTLLKANQKISVDEIAVGDWLVVMGLIIDDTFTPKRILVSAKSLRPKNHIIMLGTIIEQSSKKIIILSRQNEEVSLKISTKIEYQDHDGEDALGSEFTEDIQVLIIGDEDDNGKNASIIRSLVSLEAL